MFVRKKPNKSGSVSVQVVAKTKSRRQKVIKSIGSSKDPKEIERLMAEGRDYINRHHEPLLPGIDEEEIGFERFLGQLNNSQIQVVGPELVFGRLYDRIGYDKISSEMFRHMVICRLFNPGSKMKTVDYLERYLHVRYSLSKVYRFLDDLCYRPEEDEEEVAEKKGENVPGANEGRKSDARQKKGQDYKAIVEQVSYEHTKKVVGGEVTVCFYDMTTLYFEAAEEDELRKCGFSKDGKHSCPQIFLGLLVASGGNPIGYEIYEGSISEGKTIIPVVQALADRFGFGKPVVVADAGLLSKDNTEALVKDGYQYILGARPKNESEKVKESILALNLKYGDVAEVKRKDGSRLVVSCSEKRAAKDRHNREKGLARLQKRVRTGKLTKESINNRGYNKYLKLEGEVNVSIDLAKYEADAAWDGIKGYVTNTKLKADEVIDRYGDLWYIERAFRFNKFDLAVRPIYHRLRNRIEGHICICFTAYTILLELERILKAAKSEITVHRAQELTKTMYAISYVSPKSSLSQRVILGMSDEQQALCNLVKGGT
ncbi:MAG: IS1634 family transposase [Candidatus Cryptobacteroides sp.]|nr:IS1634 family transposase [Candidatus Cryptobacteroides sp.]